MPIDKASFVRKLGDYIPDSPAVARIVDYQLGGDTPEGAVFEENVPFGKGGGRELLLNVYRRRDTSERRPGIVFIHGGGFVGGHPLMHLRHIQQLSMRGWVAATIQYRFVQEAPLPAALEDAKCAVRWMRAHHAELGLDPNRIAAGGASAGAYLASMVALTPGRFEGTGGWLGYPSHVSAAVLFYPPVDFRPAGAASKGMAMLFGGRSSDTALAEASPIANLHPDAPPILTLTGDADRLTPVGPIRAMHSELDRLGVSNTLRVFDNMPHAFDLAPEQWEACFETLLPFLDRHVGDPSGEG